MKRRYPGVVTTIAILLIFVATAVAATYNGNTLVDLVTTTPDGSVEPVNVVDDAIREVKRAYTGTYYDHVLLTNSTGGGLVAGDVVCLNTAADTSVALCDTASSRQPYVVAVQTIANAATGYFARSGRVTVNTTGAVTRGNYIVKSVTTKVAADSTIATAATTPPPVGTIGVALTANSSNQITAYLFGTPTSSIASTTALTNGQLIIGNTGNIPSIATLTAGTNIAITNGAGTISLATTQYPQLIRKTADETVSGSTTLQNDDQLLIALAANEVVPFKCILIHVGNSTADIKVAFTTPAAAVLAWNPIGTHAQASGTVATFTLITASGTAADFTASTDVQTISVGGIIVNGANAGNLQLQWAQNTSDGVSSIVKTNSHCIAHRGGS